MLDLLGLVGLLDDHIRLRETVFDVAVADRDVLDEIVLGVIVNHRSARDHRLVRIKYRRKQLVFDLDFFDSFARRGQRLGGDRSDLLADITHLVARHDRLVGDEHAESILPWHVGTGDDPLDAHYRFGVRGVDRNDARVRMRAAQNLHMQHARQNHVACVAQRAGHLGRRIDTANVDADILAVFHVQIVERIRRQLAVEEVARHFHGVENLLITGAAADVAAKPLADFIAVGIRIEAQRCRGGHHHARDAVTTLARTGLVKGFLHGRHLAGLGEALDRLDGLALELRGRQQTRLHQRAINEDGTRAAFTGAAALLGAGHVQIVAQEIERALRWIDVLFDAAAVNGRLDGQQVSHWRPPLQSRRRCHLRLLSS